MAVYQGQLADKRGLYAGRGIRWLILAVWAGLLMGVTVGSLLPAASPWMQVVCRLHVSDKVLHFCAYFALALLPVVGFRDGRRGMLVGLSMFVVGLALEASQQLAPGRSVEFRDVLANGAGVGCGALLGLPVRIWIAFFL